MNWFTGVETFAIRPSRTTAPFQWSISLGFRCGLATNYDRTAKRLADFLKARAVPTPLAVLITAPFFNTNSWAVESISNKPFGHSASSHVLGRGIFPIAHA